LSSESRKPDSKKGESRGCVSKVDPAKLEMVSDYLKRTVSERPYAFILESLTERLELDKVDRRLLSVGLIPVPTDFDPRRFLEEKTVAFVPYCCKPFDCPSNSESGRKSNVCAAIEGSCDHTGCTVGKFVQVAKKLGAREFYVIESDGGLFVWLAEKRKEGYTHVIGTACEFAVSYALEVIHGQLGFDGYIVTINGDKCKTKEEYSESDMADRDRLTFIDEWTITTLGEMADALVEENHKNARAKANGVVAEQHK
jgi:hypothetical protein